jgi:hypothetical protein
MKILIFILFYFVFINQPHAQNVGIGTNIPTYPLTVIGVAQGKGIVQKTGTVEVGFFTSANSAYVQTWSNHPLSFSTNNGSPQMILNVTGLGIGIGEGNLPTAKLDVDGSVRIRSDVDVNLDNLWAKHIRLDNNASGSENGVIVYDGTMKFRNFKSASGFAFVNSAAVTIATINSNGNLIITGTLTSSDERLKKEISHIEDPMKVLNQLNGYHYYWKDDWRAPERQSGLLAQEVEKVLPELVGEDENGIKAVNYMAMIPYLLEAVKEIKAENEKLKKEISKLKVGAN